jgi:hypothetical protein
MAAGRLPDFLVIGAMKAGSTSLHVWLDQQPELWGVPEKEPHFFSQDWVWSRGLDWYTQLYDGAPPGAMAFESSTSYSDPEYADAAAARIHDVVPDARLVYVVRHPIDRLRSDYRHSVGEARQRLPLGEAVLDPACGHVARSMYHRCLEPYRRRFRPDQLAVVTFEELVRPPHASWDAVLAHLGLDPRPAPGTRHNAAEDRAYVRGAKNLLRRTGLLPVARRLPRGVKRLGARLVTTDPADDGLLASVSDEIPSTVADALWSDVAELEEWLGLEAPLWAPGSATAATGGGATHGSA